MQFSPEVLAVAEDMVSRRRYIHQHPELSFEEFETTAYIENRLKEIGGYEIKRITKTGLIADLKGGHPGKRIA
ncbi:MAG: amidohydrolase, partial [Lachnospiraceae bacterium]|nr:amidohydrolase [Lachnospiraceae bacterium]